MGRNHASESAKASGTTEPSGLSFAEFARITGWVCQEPIDREQRSGRLVLAAMKRENHPPCDIVVRNISSTGIGARLEGPAPSIGEKILLTVLNLEDIPATVRWVKGNRLGLHLAHPLDPAGLRLTERQQEVAGTDRPWEVPDRAPRPGFGSFG